MSNMQKERIVELESLIDDMQKYIDILNERNNELEMQADEIFFNSLYGRQTLKELEFYKQLSKVNRTHIENRDKKIKALIKKIVLLQAKNSDLM